MTSPASKKLLSCLALFALCIALSIGIDRAIAPSVATGSEGITETSTLDASALNEFFEGDFDQEDFNEMLATQHFKVSYEAAIPDEFSSEVLPANSFEESFAIDDTIGLVFTGSIEEAASFCNALLEQKGWKCLDKNQPMICSYAKSSGSYRTLVLQFIRISDRVVIVASTNPLRTTTQ